MHAILSPSSASRWLVCTPSAQLEAKEPYSESVYADEGSLAHRLNELMINYRLGKILEKQYKKKLKEIEAHELYTGEMYDYCENFVVYVLELFNSLPKGALLFTEEKIDLSKWVPQGFGTVDIRIVYDRILHVIDYKHGKGVPVFADKNKQLMLYSLGAWEEMSHLFEIDDIKMTIYQPRIENIDTFEMKAVDLVKWADTELKEKAALAYDGKGSFVVGDHCRWCRVKAKCKALADYNLELAKNVFAEDINPVLLTPEETVEILKKEKFFTDWLNAVTEYALDQAVNHGAQWPGMKLVEGLSRRVYADEEKVVTALIKKGFTTDDIYKPLAVKGITDITKLLGKTDFEKVVGEYVIKPPGKPVLVPETDKRPAYGATERAKQAFENE